MKLTQGSDYGMAAVLYLSQRSEDRRYSVDEISRATEIPEEFLRKLFQTLAKIRPSLQADGGDVELIKDSDEKTMAENRQM